MTVRRIGVALGIVAVILAFAAGGLYWWADRALTAGHRLALARAPAGLARLHAHHRPGARPRRLRAPAHGAGDGSAAAYDSTLRWTPPPRFRDAYGMLTRDRPAGAADSALWRAVAADATLDRFVAAARQRGWDATSRGPSGAPTPPTSSASSCRGPAAPASPARASSCGRWCAWRGTTPPARGPTWRPRWRSASRWRAASRRCSAPSPASASWPRRSAPTASSPRPPATPAWRAPRARRQAWAAGRRGTNLTLLEAAPDSALVLAADTHRAARLARRGARPPRSSPTCCACGASSSASPRPPSHALRPFVRDRDPDLARLARVAVATAERINRAPKSQRWRSILSNFSTLHP